MAMKIKFIKDLPEDNNLKASSDEIFIPQLHDTIYTVTVRSDDYIQIFIGSTQVGYGKQEHLVELIRSGCVEFFQK